MKLLFFCLISLLLFSCSSSDRTGQIESLEVLQNATSSQYAKGQEAYWKIDIYTADKTEPEGSKRFLNSLKDLLDGADSLCDPLMSELNAIRRKIVNQKGAKMRQASRPISLEYSSKFTLNKNVIPNEDDIAEIIKKIEAYRNELCRIVVESYPPRTYGKASKFVKPKLAKFENETQKGKAIDAALKTSTIFPDDIYYVKEIMSILTKQEKVWTAMLTNDENWINLSMSILSVQNLILSARSKAFGKVENRFGSCADFLSTDVLPIIVGSSNALPNDTVRFQVFLAAHNQFLEQNVLISKGGRFIKLEDGKGIVEVIVPESGEIEITGEIKRPRKSGGYWSTPWSHKINVSKEN